MASREAISKITRDVFGQLPNLNTRSGYQHLKKRLIGAISARYYPDPIDKYAKMTLPDYLNDEEQRRRLKIDQLRRRGKGPPKKGSGKRKK